MNHKASAPKWTNTHTEKHTKKKKNFPFFEGREEEILYEKEREKKKLLLLTRQLVLFILAKFTLNKLSLCWVFHVCVCVCKSVCKIQLPQQLIFRVSRFLRVCVRVCVIELVHWIYILNCQGEVRGGQNQVVVGFTLLYFYCVSLFLRGNFYTHTNWKFYYFYCNELTIKRPKLKKKKKKTSPLFLLLLCARGCQSLCHYKWWSSAHANIPPLLIPGHNLNSHKLYAILISCNINTHTHEMWMRVK